MSKVTKEEKDFVEQFKDQKYPNLGTFKNRKKHKPTWNDNDAISAGMDAAKDVNLHHGVDGAERNLLM